MSEPEDDFERGAAEEMADVPLTETEERTSRLPAGDQGDQLDQDGISVDTGADLDEEDDFEQ
jgi:hypothetical protein